MSRKARLRSAFTDWYPGLPDGWHDAIRLAEHVRRQLEQGSPKWELSARVLDDRHFEFEGGEAGPPAGNERRTFLRGPGTP